MGRFLCQQDGAARACRVPRSRSFGSQDAMLHGLRCLIYASSIPLPGRFDKQACETPDYLPVTAL